MVHWGYEGSDHCRKKMALPVIFSAMSQSSYPQLITKKIFYCLSKLWYNILSHYIIQYRTVIITRIYEYAVPVHLDLPLKIRTN